MHPYKSRPERAYWRASYSRWQQGDLSGIYLPKFSINKTTAISTAGSCFAQHVTRELRGRGYNFQDFESAPYLLPEARRRDFGYQTYSARYGNIYTSRQLLQLLQASLGLRRINEIWEDAERFRDPLRPTLEPDGFFSREEVTALRASHLAAVRRLFTETQVFIFTLGLTETWLNRESGVAYPICPGTAAGSFNPEQHVFKNLNYNEILADFLSFMRLTKKINPNFRMILTVSPVPLAATAEPQHVVVANSYSKSVLRAVAGHLHQTRDEIDYFPSYEMLTSHVARGEGYEANMRDVRPSAVSMVMSNFFEAHGDRDQELSFAPQNIAQDLVENEEIASQFRVDCEESLLDRSQSP